MTVRPYQREWADKVDAAWKRGVRRQLGRAATGTGKTVFFANLPPRFAPDRKTMVLVHREELATQARDKIQAWNPTMSVGIEMGDYEATNDNQIVVAGVPTIGRSSSSRIQKFTADEFGLLVADECHHATASTYVNVFNHLNIFEREDILSIGVTATPNRADGQGLNKIYQEIVFDLPLRAAMEQGWLAGLRGFRVNTKVSLDDVSVRAGKFNDQQLESQINTDPRNELIVQKWLEVAPGLQTVGFTQGIQHAKDLATMFKRYGVSAEAIWGNDPARADKLKWHRQQHIQVLLNAQLLTEGYDDPGVCCIIQAAPHLSATAYEQEIGRGTRIESHINNLIEARAQGLLLKKEHCIIIDAVDNSRRHSLVNLSSLFGIPGKMDLKGADILTVLKKLDEVEKKTTAGRLDGCTDFTKLDGYLEEIDLFREEIPPEIIQFSDYQWSRGREGYVLLLQKSEHVVVLPTGIGTWITSGTVKGNHFERVSDSLETAIREADILVKTVGGRMADVVALANGAWRSEKPSQHQHNIAKGLRIAIPEGATKGDAATAINKEILRRKQGKVA